MYHVDLQRTDMVCISYSIVCIQKTLPVTRWSKQDNDIEIHCNVSESPRFENSSNTRNAFQKNNTP